MAQQLSYDYMVIGSGLSGLFTAAHLSQLPAKVLLVDDGEHFGGSHRSFENEFGPINHTMQFFPWTEASAEALGALENLLGLKLLKEVREHQPLTFEKGEVTSFIGFGKEAPEFFSEIAPFLASQNMELHLEWGKIIQLLREQFKGDLAQKSIVTGFEFTNDQITNVTINGAKKVQASQIVFCGSLKRLSQLLQLHPALSSRLKTKLAKGPYWTTLRLDLIFQNQVTPQEAIHVLMGASQEDLSPCVGRFLQPSMVPSSMDPSVPSTRQISQWITHIPALEAEESEVVGESIRKIKRQVKRAYFGQMDQAEFQKNILRERITLLEYNLGSDLKLERNVQLGDITNLWIGSSQVHSERGPLAGICQSKVLLKEFGAGTLESKAQPQETNEYLIEPQ